MGARMEPTIYKPSIYKGAGIYKTGAGGGGGGAPEPLEIGGKIYRTVEINGKIWLAQNLESQFSGIPFTTTDWGSNYGSSCCYPNFSSSPAFNDCGFLYSGEACKLLRDNAESLTPGWHIANQSDWQSLFNFLGGDNVAGRELKAKTQWTMAQNNLDSVLFSLLPSGYKYGTNSGTSSLNTYAAMYAGNATGSSVRYFRFDNGNDTYWTDMDIRGAVSVRLVKD